MIGLILLAAGIACIGFALAARYEATLALRDRRKQVLQSVARKRGNPEGFRD